MKMKSGSVAAALVLSLAAAAQAEGWHFSAGPAWRARVKTEIRGAAPVPTAAGGTTRVYEPGGDDPGAGDYDPADAVERPDPDVEGDTLWGVGKAFTETTIVPGDGAARVQATDTCGPLGLKMRFGYDVWDAGPVSLALDLRFAGYWNLRSSASGHADGGTRTVTPGTDWWLFRGGPYPDDRDFTGAPNPEFGGTERGDAVTTALPGRTVRAHLKADLYQIGLGPTATWRVCPWLDVYAGAAALCNLASLDFEAGTSRASETACLFGLAAEVGLAANVTENVGLFAEVGYEWIDEGGLSAGGLRAEADFSSLVVAAGLRVRF